MHFRYAAIVVSITLPFAGPTLAQDTSWCKSKYGPNDEIGAANLLSAQGVLEAAKLIKTGKTYALGVETNKGTPAYAPRTWNMIILQPGQVGGVTLGNTKTSYNNDIWNGWVGIGSQIDGLGHIGVDNVYYNCNLGKDFAAADGLKKLGVEKIPPIVALIHTGYQPVATSDPKAFLAGEPGLGKEGAEYLVSKEVVAIGADQWALGGPPRSSQRSLSA